MRYTLKAMVKFIEVKVNYMKKSFKDDVDFFMSCQLHKNNMEYELNRSTIMGNNINNNIQQIENHANKLIELFSHYLNMINYASEEFSQKANYKAKITLRALLFPNDKEFEKEYQNIKENCGCKTQVIFKNYTRCIMQIIGQLAECVIIDHCLRNSDFNLKCINIAMYKPNISKEYPEIDYKKYAAFSTSHRIIITKDNENGLYKVHQNFDYNPNHTTKDIGWCEKDNIVSQLIVKKGKYINIAKLQVKATLDCNNLDLDPYLRSLTPVLVFDFMDDFYKLEKKYKLKLKIKNLPIYSVKHLFPELYLEMEKYFKIVGAYVVGLSDHINISDIEVQENNTLRELFRTPIKDLINEQEHNIAFINMVIDNKIELRV